MIAYGQFSLRVTSDTIDKVGIRRLILAQKWAPPRSGMSALEIVANRPAIPASPDYMSVIGIETVPVQGCLETRWTFEGASGSDKASGLKDRSNSTDYRFAPGYQSVSLQLHPEFQQLLKNYGGYVDASGRVVFSQYLSQNMASSNGLASGYQQGAALNPLYGTSSFFRMEGTYTYRYAEFTLPQGLYDDVGTPRESAELPGDVPYFKGRNWLKIPPRYQRRGPVLDISEQYWLSGPGGWPVPLYTFDNDATTTGGT